MPEKVSCVTPTAGPLIPKADATTGAAVNHKEVIKMQARVGKPAIDFELTALIGSGFKNIKLSDYKGKWIVLCFYPGDFTFV